MAGPYPDCKEIHAFPSITGPHNPATIATVGVACVVCSAPFGTRSRAHRLTRSGRCRSRLSRIRRRKGAWNAAWLAARQDAIGV